MKNAAQSVCSQFHRTEPEAAVLPGRVASSAHQSGEVNLQPSSPWVNTGPAVAGDLALDDMGSCFEFQDSFLADGSDVVSIQHSSRLPVSRG